MQPVGPDRRRSRYASLKPVLDRALGAILLVTTIPLWVLIAVAIKVESRGPILYAQERLGHNGRPFRMLKFRSMFKDAENHIGALRHLNEADGPIFKIRNDPRVTRVGRLLRRTSLDELPQLVNVLRGEMSMVGPRPPLPEEVVNYRPTDFVRLTVKPGLTCLWQVRGRSDCTFDTWMQYDQEYVAGLSFWLDTRILLRTVWVVLSGRGAY